MRYEVRIYAAYGRIRPFVIPCWSMDEMLREFDRHHIGGDVVCIEALLDGKIIKSKK